MTFTPVPPEPDGLARAFAAARRRRLRTLGLAAGAAGVAAVLAGSLLGPGAAATLTQDEEVFVDEPVATSSPRAGASPVPSTHSAGLPAVAALATATPHGSLAPAAPRTTGPTGSTAVRAGYATSALVVASVWRFPSCSVDEPAGPCQDAQATSRDGRGQLLAATVCAASTDDRVLRFQRQREVDLWVTRGNDEVWRWSLGHGDGPHVHAVTVPSGQCTDWRYDWTGVDAQGRPLPDGDYTLHVAFYADELRGRTGSMGFTLRP